MIERRSTQIFDAHFYGQILFAESNMHRNIFCCICKTAAKTLLLLKTSWEGWFGGHSKSGSCQYQHTHRHICFSFIFLSQIYCLIKRNVLYRTVFNRKNDDLSQGEIGIILRERMSKIEKLTIQMIKCWALYILEHIFFKTVLGPATGYY